ncbi:MAG: pantoate--beta-alanine ligase [Verrucomicrobiota bacterium]
MMTVSMRIVSDPGELRAWRREAEAEVGFVPTMGALHRGHLSLVQEARREVGADGVVAVSIFVNPTQFAPHEDFEDYPRPMEEDLAACEREGVDLVFVPSRELMYAEDASVSVQETMLSQHLCGASRPHFFSGVCTVVAKLFLLVQPDLAVFGEKDFQQLSIIRRMVRDMHFPIRILGGPIIREEDGLAMSSRNAYLPSEERRQAVVLWRTLQDVASAIQKEAAWEPKEVQEWLRQGIATAPSARIDYAEVMDPDTLQPLSKQGGEVLLALAVFFGETRLIDNLRISL